MVIYLSGGDFMRTLKAVDLVLENCEVITIDAEHVEMFYASDIKRSIYFQYGVCDESTSAKDIDISLIANANLYSSYTDHWNDENRPLPFDRLVKHNDITHVDVNYQDGSHEYIRVNWGGDSDMNNPNQTSRIGTDRIHIIISPNRTVEDYLNK